MVELLSIQLVMEIIVTILLVMTTTLHGVVAQIQQQFFKAYMLKWYFLTGMIFKLMDYPSVPVTITLQLLVLVLPQTKGILTGTHSLFRVLMQVLILVS